MSFSSWITRLFTKPNKSKSQKHIPLTLQSLEGRVTPALPFSSAFPTAVSIVTNTGSDGAPASSSADFIVTFSDAVSGVDSFDFSTVRTGNVAVGSLEVSGSGKTYTVTAKGVTGDGQLGLNLLSNASISATASFAPQATFGPGKIGTREVALGDFNLDQRLDIVSMDESGPFVFLNTGNGAFSAPTNFAVEGGALNLSLGDVNSDNNLDIITTSFKSFDNGIVSVLLGNGNGTFATPATFACGDFPELVNLGDVNGDGKLDIVTANTFNTKASVLLGNGKGAFGTQSAIEIGSSSESFSLGDVNGDKNLDIVTVSGVTGPGRVLLGNGNGTFGAGQTFEGGSQLFRVTLGDVNGDKNLDIVSAGDGFSGPDDFNVTILLGNGNATFSSPATFKINSLAQSVSLGDVNDDSNLDIVTLGGDSASVLLGDGKGSFATQTTFAVGPGVFSGALGDLEFDGKLDIVSGNGGNNSIGILKGNGNGTFENQTTFGVGVGDLTSVELGDVNGDGKVDIVTANPLSNNISVLLGNGNGSFATLTTFSAGNNPYSVALGDVNGDGKLDLVTGNNDFPNPYSSTLLGNGDGTFSNPFPSAMGGTGGLLGDVNGDGKLDLVSAYGQLGQYGKAIVQLGNGNGTFSSPATFGVGRTPKSLSLGDVNGDGKLDIVTSNQYGGGVSVLLGNGDGSFGPQTTFAVVSRPSSESLGDVNGDGKLDIIAVSGGFSNDTVNVLLGDGKGSFAAPTTFAVAGIPDSVTLGDVNGDGRLDIVTRESVFLGNGDGTFGAQNTFANGGASATLVDVNNDGRLDIVTGNFSNNTLGVLLGNNSSSSTVQFAPQATFGVGFDFPSSLALGDVNGDGKIDMVTGSFGTTASVFLGIGNGAFATQTTFSNGTGGDLTLGDVNGDKTLDIVTAGGSVLLGNGDGTFAAPTTYSVYGSRILTLGDVNGDSKLDIVTAAASGFGLIGFSSVFLNNGNASFSPPTTFAVGNNPGSVALGDMNGDGNQDIVTVNSLGASNSVLLGNGNGTFASQQTFSSVFTSNSMALGDVNGDGKLDIVNDASVLLGNGNGTFAAPTTFLAGSNVRGISLGDVSGDGKLDIVATDYFNNSTSVLLGIGDGTFQARATFGVGINPNSVALGDMNGDGDLDIVTTNGNNTVSVLLGNSTGAFGSQAAIGPGVSGLASVAFGDVNGDGKADIVTANSKSNNASVFLGNGNGTFAAQTTFGVGDSPSTVTLGDVNGDGKLDIVTANRDSGNASVLLGNGNGLFVTQATFELANRPNSGTLGDVNGDGKLDIIAVGPGFSSNGNASVLLGNGNGTFATQASFEVGVFPASVSLGDVNSDGKLDIVTANTLSNNSTVLLGNGNGIFATQATFETGVNPSSVALGDVNGDGKLDIVTTNGNSTTSVLLGNGNGSFAVPTTFSVAGFSNSVTLGDVNGDGKLDIVTAIPFSATASVLLGNGDGTFQPLVTFAAGDDPQSVTLGDVNNDGRLDLITGNGPDNTVSVLLNSIEFKGQVYNITNNAPPTITSGNSATFTVGQVGAFSVAANGTPTPTISTSGTLPIGVTLSPAGTLSGIPTQGGKFNFDIIATNGVTPDATQGFTLTVDPAATTTVLTATPDPFVFGHLVSLQATVTSSGIIPSGNVTFELTELEDPFGSIPTFLGTVPLDSKGIANSGFITSTFGLGNVSITATFNANDSFSTSTNSLTQTITKANSTTTLASTVNPSVNGQSTTLTAKVTTVALGALPTTNFGNGPVITFRNGSEILGTASLTLDPSFTFGAASLSLTSLPVGVLSLTAEYPGNDTLNSSIGSISQTVSPFGAATALSLTTSASNAVAGNAFGVQPVVTIKDAFGNTVTNSTAAVTLAASTGATLVGTATVNAVNGVATFINAGLNGNAGTYTLTYSSGGFTLASQSINLGSGTSPVVVGTTGGSSQGSTVTIVDPATGQVTGTVVPFPNFKGEIRVAAGDLNNDGKTETIAAAGPGGGPAVNIIDSNGKTTAAFFAYDPAFTGGCFITVSDVNNDGFADIITGAGEGGGPHVKIFNGKDLSVMGSFFAYAEDFKGGVSVASADINGDGFLDVVTGAGPGGGPHVKVFDGKSNALISQWFAYATDFTGGVFVGIGDIGNDGKFEVVTGAGVGGGPVVAVFNPFTGALQAQFFAYGESFTGGVRVGVSDGNSDGVADLVTGAGPGGGPHVKGFNFPALDLLFEFFSGPADDTGGVFVN